MLTWLKGTNAQQAAQEAVQGDTFVDAVETLQRAPDSGKAAIQPANISTEAVQCFNGTSAIDPATLEQHAPKPALLSVAGVFKYGPRGIVERAFGHGMQAAKEKIEHTGKQMQNAAGIAGGSVACGVAIARLGHTIRELTYGPELEHKANDVQIHVDTLLTVKDALTPEVGTLLEDIRDENTQLIVDIKKYYQRTNGLRLVGGAAGAIGGALTTASRFVEGGDRAARMAKCGVGLVAGMVGTEVVAGVADWFTNHHERLRVLSTKLEAIKDTVALVPVPWLCGQSAEATGSSSQGYRRNIRQPFLKRGRP